MLTPTASTKDSRIMVARGNSSDVRYRSRVTSNNNNDRTSEKTGCLQIGLYGVPKNCLYLIVFALMLLITLNLGLTLWILKVMEFSVHGMGQLKVVPGGLQLTGQAIVMDQLRASTIRSRHGQPIVLESARNLTVYSKDEHGKLRNKITLGDDTLETTASAFRITDTHGHNLFSVADNEVSVGANSLRVEGEGGAVFRESIQTPLLRADAGRELRLESPTRALEVSASQEIQLQSRAGSLEATSLDDFKLTSVAGSINLDSRNIRLANLKATPATSSPGMSSNHHDHSHLMYQVCACANGKLFMAPSHGVCAGDDQTVCR